MRKIKALPLGKIISWLVQSFVVAVFAGMLFMTSFNKTEIVSVGTGDSIEFYGGIYDNSKNLFTIDSNKAKFIFPKTEKDVQYFYLYLYIENLSTDAVKAEFRFYNQEDIRITSFKNYMGNGCNVYTLPVNGAFSKMRLFIKGAEGISFSIRKVELCQELKSFSAKRLLAGGFFGWCIYFFVSVLLYYKTTLACLWKTAAENLFQIIQFVFFIQEKPASWLYHHTNEKIRYRLRIGLLSGLNIYMICMDYFDLYAINKYYKYHILFAAMILLIVAWLLYEGKPEYQHWESSFFMDWCLLWTFVCICDAWMGSMYIITGYIMLFFMGNVFFFWGSQKSDKKVFLREIILSMKIGLFIWVIALFLKRPHLPEVRDFINAVQNWLLELNMLGHTGSLQNSSRFINGYNGLMELIYRYGIWIVFPYINLWLHTLQLGWNCKKNIKEIFVLELLFSVLLLYFNVERPFLFPVWTAYYLHMGYFMIKSNIEKA